MCPPTISVIAGNSERNFAVFWVQDSSDRCYDFDTIKDLQQYVEDRHVEEGGFDWISEIGDSMGNHYGCTWTLEIEEI
mgnify:CR=1 FL=1